MPAAVAPPKIIDTGPGIYSQVPAQEIPVWAIVLICLGGVAIALLVVLLVVLVRRRRPPANDSSDGGQRPHGEPPEPEHPVVDSPAGR